MITEIRSPVLVTDCAVDKIKFFIKNNNHKNLKLRVYIESGGCGGFQYGFVLDHRVSNNDYIIENNGAILVIDSLSLQYLVGGTIDYYEGLEGSKFFITNPNAKMTCSCGLSFSI